MVIDIRTKLLIKSGAQEMLYVELTPKNCTSYTENACAQETLILTCAEHASTTSPVNETQK